MSYLARLKAADLTDAPTRTTAKTATNSSGSYGGIQKGAHFRKRMRAASPQYRTANNR